MRPNGTPPFQNSQMFHDDTGLYNIPQDTTKSQLMLHAHLQRHHFTKRQTKRNKICHKESPFQKTSAHVCKNNELGRTMKNPCHKSHTSSQLMNEWISIRTTSPISCVGIRPHMPWARHVCQLKDLKSIPFCLAKLRSLGLLWTKNCSKYFSSYVR